MNQNEALAQISRLMCENGLTSAQVNEYLENKVPAEQQFDVAVILDGKVCRLPLIVAEEMHPMGIYPFKYGPYSNYYIELTEQNGIQRKEAVSRCKGGQELPSVGFWAAIDKITYQLNRVLTRLNGIQLSGSYYAGRNSIWVIGEGEITYCSMVHAQTRYVVRK